MLNFRLYSTGSAFIVKTNLVPFLSGIYCRRREPLGYGLYLQSHEEPAGRFMRKLNYLSPLDKNIPRAFVRI